MNADRSTSATHDQLQQAIGELREELQRQITKHSERLDDVDRRIGLALGHITRIGEEGRDQRMNLIESNRYLAEMVQGFRQTLDVLVAEHQRGLNAFNIAQDTFNRNANGNAARIASLEKAVGRLLPPTERS